MECRKGEGFLVFSLSNVFIELKLFNLKKQLGILFGKGRNKFQNAGNGFLDATFILGNGLSNFSRRERRVFGSLGQIERRREKLELGDFVNVLRRPRVCFMMTGCIRRSLKCTIKQLSFSNYSTAFTVAR